MGISAPTRLEVDLGAIVANWRLLAGRAAATRAGARAAAVVKADGYGLGAIAIATALAAAGCDDFFVATLDEALALRAALPQPRIGVLNGLGFAPAAAFVVARLHPVLNDLGQIDAWTAQARARGQSLPALLHVDTGMNRLGLSAAEVASLAATPGRLAGIALVAIMTHLAEAERAGSEQTAAQLARFAAARALLPPAPTSIANSAGIFAAGTASDLARPGAALYGISPCPEAANPMRQVVRLSAQVIGLHSLRAGERVGYEGSWVAERPSRIATVAVGYADGLPRAASNRAGARFDGAVVPLVGRVSMDLSTFDVTDQPGLVPGDWLELIGPDNPPDALARAAGTIGYEILTGLGPRLPRVYLPAAPA